jgi:hypothetical protein
MSEHSFAQYSATIKTQKWCIRVCFDTTDSFFCYDLMGGGHEHFLIGTLQFTACNYPLISFNANNYCAYCSDIQ